MTPVHLRHLVVHQHEAVVDAAAGLDRLDAVDGDVDLAAQHFEHAHRGHLVRVIVFGQQHARPAKAGRLLERVQP